MFQCSPVSLFLLQELYGQQEATSFDCKDCFSQLTYSVSKHFQSVFIALFYSFKSSVVNINNYSVNFYWIWVRECALRKALNCSPLFILSSAEMEALTDPRSTNCSKDRGLRREEKIGEKNLRGDMRKNNQDTHPCWILLPDWMLISTLLISLRLYMYLKRRDQDTVGLGKSKWLPLEIHHFWQRELIQTFQMTVWSLGDCSMDAIGITVICVCFFFFF